MGYYPFLLLFTWILKLFSLASRSAFKLCPFDLSPSLTQWNVPDSTWTFPVPALDSAILQGALAPFLENGTQNSCLFTINQTLPTGNVSSHRVPGSSNRTRELSFLGGTVHPHEGNCISDVFSYR